MYIAPLSFDKDDKPDKMGTSKRSFCTECSSMLWNYHDEFPDVRPSNLFLILPTSFSRRLPIHPFTALMRVGIVDLPFRIYH